MRVAELLFQRGADVSIQGTNKQVSLHKVARWRDDLSDGALPLLLKHRADVNARDAHNTSPLHSTSYYLRLKTVQMFLDLGANVNAEDDWGRTPFHGASADKDDDGEVFFRCRKASNGAWCGRERVKHKPQNPLTPCIAPCVAQSGLVSSQTRCRSKCEERRGKDPIPAYTGVYQRTNGMIAIRILYWAGKAGTGSSIDGSTLWLLVPGRQ